MLNASRNIVPRLGGREWVANDKFDESGFYSDAVLA
jgi:hypothetical protein